MGVGANCLPAQDLSQHGVGEGREARGKGRWRLKGEGGIRSEFPLFDWSVASYVDLVDKKCAICGHTHILADVGP